MATLLVGLAIAAVVASLLTWRRPLRGQRRSHGGADVGMGLRTQVLSRAVFANVPASGSDQPRCVVMDWNLGGTNVATLVAFDDGTTSLYLSSGGGIIGAGAHDAVKRAAGKFRETAIAERTRFAAVTRFDLPSDGKTVFYLVTAAATFASEAISNAELQDGSHPLARLAGRAQAVIATVRETSGAPD